MDAAWAWQQLRGEGGGGGKCCFMEPDTHLCTEASAREHLLKVPLTDCVCTVHCAEEACSLI